MNIDGIKLIGIGIIILTLAAGLGMLDRHEEEQTRLLRTMCEGQLENERCQ